MGGWISVHWHMLDTDTITNNYIIIYYIYFKYPNPKPPHRYNIYNSEDGIQKDDIDSAGHVPLELTWLLFDPMDFQCKQ